MKSVHVQMSLDIGGAIKDFWFFNLELNSIIQDVANGKKELNKGESLNLSEKQMIEAVKRWVSIPTEKDYQINQFTKAISLVHNDGAKVTYKMVSRGKEETDGTD